MKEAVRNFLPCLCFFFTDSGGVQKFAGQTVDGNGNGLCSGANCAERGSAISGAMWFGPRLGRRRRSGEKTETYDDDQINAIAEAMEGAPWTVVSIQGTESCSLRVCWAEEWMGVDPSFSVRLTGSMLRPLAPWVPPSSQIYFR